MHPDEAVAIVIQDSRAWWKGARRTVARGSGIASPAPGFFGGRGRGG